jgi:predicted phosphodiesterase
MRRFGLPLRLLAAVSLAAGLAFATPPQAPTPAGEKAVALPNKEGTLKFGVLGDFGTGEPPQYKMAEQIARTYQTFKFKLMLLVGDNLYGSERPQDFRSKFEVPYKPLLDAGVVFRAALGNHDSREQRQYPQFNMNGELYYTFTDQNARFYVLESTYPEPEQIVWLEKELKASNSDWKIAYFHHSLYSSAGRHGSDSALRAKLEPLFVAYNVSVVFTGHDHTYERVKPQKGITHFVVGSGGKLSPGDLDRSSPIMAKGYDAELVFLVAEIDGDVMTFNAISQSGKVIDSGTITRRKTK